MHFNRLSTFVNALVVNFLEIFFAILITQFIYVDIVGIAFDVQWIIAQTQFLMIYDV
jgi:hypothetical protein